MFTSRASLEIGFWGNLHEKRYQIVGGNVWKLDYNEYFSNSEESGYTRTAWTYTEWILRTEANEYAYLIEDKTGFWFSLPFEATDKTIPKVEANQFADFQNQGGTYPITQFGFMSLQQGEATTPKSKYFWLYESAGNQYSLEIPLTENNELLADQSAYTVAMPKKFLEVTEAFQENAKVHQKGITQKRMKFALSVSRALAWLFFLLYMGGGCTQSQVAEYRFDVKDGYMVDEYDSTKANGEHLEFYSPKWMSGSWGANYEVRVEASFGAIPFGRDNIEMFVKTVIVDSENEATAYYEDMLWTEQGHDSEESWTESHTNISFPASTGKAGEHFAWITIERSAPLVQAGASFYVSIQRTYIDSSAMFYAWILFLILRIGFWFYVRK